MTRNPHAAAPIPSPASHRSVPRASTAPRQEQQGRETPSPAEGVNPGRAPWFDEEAALLVFCTAAYLVGWLLA